MFPSEAMKKAIELKPDIRISKRGNCYTFKIGRLKGDELFPCPFLDNKKGCILSDEKPFECRIWPYRVMKLDSDRLIAVSPVCETVFSKPLSELIAFLKNGLSERIFEYADTYPEIVKQYDSSYPILMFEK